MGMLAWVMMGLALWHFSIWLPDRFWAGIVGALIGAIIGAFLSGFLIAGATIPGRAATTIGTPLAAIPGALLGMALIWFIGVRREHAVPAAATS